MVIPDCMEGIEVVDVKPPVATDEFQLDEVLVFGIFCRTSIVDTNWWEISVCLMDGHVAANECLRVAVSRNSRPIDEIMASIADGSDRLSSLPIRSAPPRLRQQHETETICTFAEVLKSMWRMYDPKSLTITSPAIAFEARDGTLVLSGREKQRGMSLKFTDRIQVEGFNKAHAHSYLILTAKREQELLVTGFFEPCEVLFAPV